MEHTEIRWLSGEGSFSVTYTGNGNGSVTIHSGVNEGLDREQPIEIITTKGNEPKSVSVNVKQIGRREMFVCSDGGFTLYDGGTLNVLKDEL